MSHFLTRLPPELLAPIVSELTLNDKKHVSLTDSTMRKIMAPYLYTTMVIDCPLLEGSSLSDVAQKYGVFVNNLHLRLHIYPNKEETDREEGYEESDEDEVDGRSVTEDEENKTVQESQQEGCHSDKEAEDDTGLSYGDFDYETFWKHPPASVWARNAADAPIVRDIIQSKGLPHCRTLRITIDPNKNHKLYHERYWDDYSYERGHFCRSSEIWDNVRRHEKVYAWRAAMRDMWCDIATLSTAERLVIHDFMPKRITAWLKPEWASFLGRLKDLTLFLYGRYHEIPFPAYVYYGFRHFLNQLSTDMWLHLSNLERLKIVAHEKGFIDDKSVEFPIGSMPALRAIYLENVTAPEVLTDFLRGGCPHLEEVHLKDCVAAAWRLKNVTTWAELWKAARETGKKPLCIIWEESDVAPLESDDDSDENVRGAWAHLYKTLGDGERRRIWPYVELNGDGMYMPDDIVEYLEERDDNQKYIKLVEEMERRRSQISHGV